MKRFTLILLAVIAVTFSAMAQSGKPKLVFAFKSECKMYDDGEDEPRTVEDAVIRIAYIYEKEICFYTSEMKKVLTMQYDEVESGGAIYVFSKKDGHTFVFSTDTGVSMLYNRGKLTFGFYLDSAKTKELMDKYGI